MQPLARSKLDSNPLANVPTPESLGLASGRIALSTGVELHYVEQGDLEGDVLILLHGYSDSWHSWERNLPLIDPSFHVYALSMHGHGDSGKPAAGYSQSDFADDIVAFMDGLGIDRATLIGHSGGSFIAHHVATRRPERVKRLVLIDSAPTMMTNAPLNELYADVVTLADPVGPEFVREFQSSTAVRPIPASFLETVIAESLKLPASVWQQTLAGMLAEDHSEQLRNIAVPTLIIWGERDEMFTLDDQHALIALIPHSTFRSFEGTGHAAHWEQPERFVEHLHAFLA